MTWMPGTEAAFEGLGVDRAPPRAVRHASRRRDAAGPLRRDDVGDISLVAGEVGGDRHGRRIDRGDLAAIGQRDPFEDAGIQGGPGGLEQLLLAELVLGVQHQQLRARLVGLQIPCHQARALIGAGRAAIGVRGHRHHHGPAIRHGAELVAQQRRLRPGLPGVRHALRRGFGVAGQGIEAEVDAGREDEAVVVEGAAVMADAPGCGVHAGGGGAHEANAGGGHLVPAEALLVQLAQAGQDGVAERAGQVVRRGLDERHVMRRGQNPGRGGARKAAAHDHHPGATLRPRDGGGRKHRAKNDTALQALSRWERVG